MVIIFRSPESQDTSRKVIAKQFSCLNGNKDNILMFNCIHSVNLRKDFLLGSYTRDFHWCFNEELVGGVLWWRRITFSFEYWYYQIAKPVGRTITMNRGRHQPSCDVVREVSQPSNTAAYNSWVAVIWETFHFIQIAYDGSMWIWHSAYVQWNV